MTSNAIERLRERYDELFRTRFGCLVRIFMARMLRGGSDVEAGGLDLGVGVVLILLAMPGTLASLLMFEEYGSLIRFLRRQGPFDPFAATIPDEYFFIVLSLVVSGVVALWKWDVIFLDRRDYMNLVPLPLSLRTIFFANLCAVVCLAGLLTVVVNGVSLFLFPVAVVGSQGSFSLFLRFAMGHAGAVFLASTFSFFAVLAVAGLLMSLLPSSLFRRVWLSVRFFGAIGFFTLLTTSFAVPDWLKGLSIETAHRIAIFPPVAFLGIARTLWGKGSDPFTATMTKGALTSLAVAIITAIITYSLSFRRSFLRIPETADASPTPRMSRSFSPVAQYHKLTMKLPSEYACYLFVVRTVLRSEGHLQVVLGSLGVSVVAAAETLTAASHYGSLWKRTVPSLEFLSVPFILSYCIVVAIRMAFEIPLDLRANWIFRFWVEPNEHDTRSVARRVLLAPSLLILGPAGFVLTTVFWGWPTALIHTIIFTVCTALLVEVLIVGFRKIPFTCPYPAFKRNSPLVFVVYVSGFFVFTNYLPQLDRWCVLNPVRAPWLIPLAGIITIVLYVYRRAMLDVDKQLTFEDVSESGFW